MSPAPFDQLLKGLETRTPVYKPASIVRVLAYAQNLAKEHNPQCVVRGKGEAQPGRSHQQPGSQGGGSGKQSGHGSSGAGSSH